MSVSVPDPVDEEKHAVAARTLHRPTLNSPTAFCLNVVLRLMAGMTAPVSSEGSEPTWIARVEKPCPATSPCSWSVRAWAAWWALLLLAAAASAAATAAALPLLPAAPPAWWRLSRV